MSNPLMRAELRERDSAIEPCSSPAKDSVKDEPTSDIQTLSLDDNALEAEPEHWPNLYRLRRALFSDGRVGRETRALCVATEEFIGYICYFESQREEKQEYEALQDQLEGIFDRLRQCFSKDTPPAMTGATRRLCWLVERELTYVQEKQGFGSQILYTGEKNGNDVLVHYCNVRDYFERIQLGLQHVDMAEIRRRLRHLLPALFTRHNHSDLDVAEHSPSNQGTRVSPGTRVEILSQIHVWVSDPSSGSVYWINGMAGTGKTAIAYTLCFELDLNHELAASIFCSRWLPECRDSSLIIPFIAYQLAIYCVPFRRAFLDAIKGPGLDAIHGPPDRQFTSLIYQPFLEVANTLPDRLVVVIDSLDMCEPKYETSQLLEVLMQESELPIKFIVVSRPEPQIRGPMKMQRYQETSRVVLHEIDSHAVQEDIKLYLKRPLWPFLAWNPTDEQISALLKRAGVLFIFAAMDILYIKNGEPDYTRRLAKLLESPESPNMQPEWNDYVMRMDELVYAPILEEALGNPNITTEEEDDMRRVLYLVTTSQTPLTVDQISKELNMNNTNRVWEALQPFWSVLRISEDAGTVEILHPSFADYILNRERSKRYCCSPKVMTRA